MNLSPLPIQKFFANNGRPLAGGLLFTYEAGTSDKIETYTDASGGSLNTNPIVLDYRGEARIWLDVTKTYKFVLAPAADTDPPTGAIWTVDNIAASLSLADLTQQIIGGILYPQTVAEMSVGVTPADYGYPELAPLRYASSAEQLSVASYILTNEPPTSVDAVKVGGFGVFGNGAFNTNNAVGDPAHIVEIVNDNSPDQCFRFNSYGATSFGNNVHWCRYFGTQAAPSAIGAGAFLMSHGYRGWDGSGILSQSMAAFQCLTTEAWTPTAHGVKFHFACAANGSSSRTEILDIDSSGLHVGNFTIPTWNINYAVCEVGAPGTAIRGNRATGAELSITSNSYADAVGHKYGVTSGTAMYQLVADRHIFYNAASGTANTAVVYSEVGRFDTNGYFIAGANGAGAGRAYHNLLSLVAEGATIFLARSETTAVASLQALAVSSAGFNAADAAMYVGKNSGNSRSINAGGTLNASGADYAEYMRKADGCGAIEKGAICGVTANGELTDRWSDAVSFVVKSTDPSYVGGDVWGTHLTRPETPDVVTPEYEATLAAFESELEACRERVDRIAFAGQVPCNVIGARPGDYIVPQQDGTSISGVAVASPSFEQYRVAVGKVIAIEGDGRSRIIIKVA